MPLRRNTIIRIVVLENNPRCDYTVGRHHEGELTMGIKLYSKGGAGEVTGSRHYLATGNATIQIDCGAFQGRRAEAERKNRNIDSDVSGVDAVVLTHAHFDHSGMLPLLIKDGYNGNVFATPATRDLSSLIMLDSAKIQARDIEFLLKQAKRHGETFEGEPLYDEKDAVSATNQIVTVSYDRPLPIAADTTLTFVDAGHILGSALAVLDINQNDKQIRVAFSGDLGRNNKAIIRDPQKIPDPDYLIMESTYGDRLHENQDDALEKLAEVVSSTAAKGGKIVIPSFAVERTQELIYMLHLLTDQGKIPDIPVFVDSPMATNATSIFRVHPECYDKETNDAFIQHHKNPFGFNGLKYTASVEDSKEINNVKGSAIIIASDGMCEAGRIRHHLIRTVEDEKNTILIVGYMAAHTLGRRIKEKQPNIRIFRGHYDLKARVESIDAFSAHADYSEIRDYIKQLDLRRLKKVFLVHGEEDAQKHLKKVLLETGVREVESVTYGTTYELG
jgi:metallo-beta-lactamase family protein